MTLPLVDHSHTTLGRVVDMPESRRRSYTGSSSDSCSPPSSEASLPTDTYDHEITGYRANMMNSGHIKTSTQPPALPDKSSRRASRFLEPRTPPRPQSKTRAVVTATATPYDIYLSSEEDASSSADAFSDFEIESDDEDHKKPRSIAITARIVSVIFSGKPSIVELPARSRTSGSSESLAIKHVDTSPALDRRLSATSLASSVTMSHPPRSSSRMHSSIERPNRPSFLNTDPFPTAIGEEIERPVTPLTPTAMLKRGLSLVKKRSRAQLSPATSSLYSHSSENFSVQTLPVDPAEERQSRQLSESPVEVKSPGYYQEIMRAARRKTRGVQESDTASVLSNSNNLSKLRSGFSLSRRRSIKA
ncbi:hypothetical protein LIA77_02499 [Sarocladium implicatum]|nr:hypothetical protein LIA77_02499 [Sarocladium implicatum]